MARERGDEAMVDVVAEHDERARDGPCRGREAGEAHEHGARDALGRQLVHPRRLLGARVDRLRGDGARQLVQQEGIAAADLVARRRERAVGLLAQLGSEQRRRGRGAERARREAACEAVCRDPRQAARGARLIRAARDGEHDGQLLDARRQEADEVERGRVGPMRVVDREQQRGLLGERRGQPVEAVQDRERVGDTAAGGGGRRPVREPERAARRIGGALEQRLPLGGVEGREMRPEQLAHEREREVALEFGRARCQHAHPGYLPRAAEGLQQTGLTEPGGRVDHGEAAAPGVRVADHRVELGELALPLEQSAHVLLGSGSGCLPAGGCSHRGRDSSHMKRSLP